MFVVTRALIVKPNSSPVPNNWNGPYLKKKAVPRDPWGNDYHYTYPGRYNKKGYDIVSYAADNMPGGKGESDPPKEITDPSTIKAPAVVRHIPIALSKA